MTLTELVRHARDTACRHRDEAEVEMGQPSDSNREFWVIRYGVWKAKALQYGWYLQERIARFH